MTEDQYTFILEKMSIMEKKIDKLSGVEHKIDRLSDELTFYKGTIKGVAVIGFALWGFVAYVGSNYQKVKDDNDQRLFSMVYAQENRISRLEVIQDENSKN